MIPLSLYRATMYPMGKLWSDGVCMPGILTSYRAGWSTKVIYHLKYRQMFIM